MHLSRHLALLLLAFAPLAQGFVLSGFFPIHQGVLEAVTATSPIALVEGRFSRIDFSRCTGTFITDQWLVTAAHCLDHTGRTCVDAATCTSRAQSVTVSIPRKDATRSWMQELATTTAFWTSTPESDLDLALVQLPPGTFKGLPMPFEVLTSEALDRLEEAQSDGQIQFTTYGFGATEAADKSDQLRSSPVPDLRLTAREFSTSDTFRVDHGDSGGPLVARAPYLRGGKPFLVAVNHAYRKDDPTLQYFKPLQPAFFAGLEAQGVALPKTSCSCKETFTYSRMSGERVRETWTQPGPGTFARQLPFGTRDCSELESPEAVDEYGAEADPQDPSAEPIVVRRKSSGIRCALSR